jgi:formylglycine-generating enzyme required for sulfatase activity
MVKVPGGDFLMGSPKTEAGRYDDEDQQSVSVKAFAAGKYPVTKQQWAAFASATNRQIAKADCSYAPGDNPTWKNPGYPQADDHPVVCITWGDANDYAQWLTAKTGHTYRLLTLAEGEYAARAGSTKAFAWGDKASHAFANYGLDTCCGTATDGRDRWEFTSPVGAFPPNAFGLYDMSGNVFIWLATCADKIEKGLPIPKVATGCTYRYARGGAYGERPQMMRSAARNLAPPPGDKMTIESYRSAGFGFRVARDL